MTFAITSLYAGLLGLLLLFLSALVVRSRIIHKVVLWDGGKIEVLRAIRAHGNFVEYVPFALLLILLLELNGFEAWILHTLGLALVAGRVLHAHGLYSSENVTKGRFIGTNLTWGTIGVSSVLLLLKAGGVF